MIGLFQRILGGLVGFFCAVKLPAFILRGIIRVYVRAYHVDMSIYEKSICDFNTFDDFFTRKVSPEFRTINEGVVSPVDASVYACGKVGNGMMLQVKSQSIAVDGLLNCENNLAKYFISMYLSPADYHRYHAPCDLEILSAKYIPGYFYSVRPSVARRKPVFLKNERVVLETQTEYGKLWLVFIGAQNVGKIGLTALDGNCPKGKYKTDIQLLGKVKYSKGDELGTFHMGSSVVMLSENIHFKIPDGTTVKMGEMVSMGAE